MMNRMNDDDLKAAADRNTPAAYTTEKANELLTDATVYVGVLLGCAIGIVVAVFARDILPSVVLIFLAAVSAISGVYFFVTALNRRKNWVRGGLGEILTARSLMDGLTRPGWFVFHGLKIPDSGDIDHIVVSPKGVFAIETKTPRGHSIDCEKGFLRVDGRALRTPDPIEQVKKNARYLNGLLKQLAGVRKWIHPIVCLPGFDFEAFKTQGVEVMTPEQLCRVFSSEQNLPDDLRDSEIKKVADIIKEELASTQS